MRSIAILFVVAALAGCSSDGDSDSTSTSSSTSTTTGPDPTTKPGSTQTQTQTQTSGGNATPAPNTPPTASLNITTDGLSATFALDAQDADGDALSWTLDVDGDGVVDAEGTDVPANHTQELVAGSYTANLTVSDGIDVVHVLTPFSIEELAPAFEPVIFSGSVAYSCEHCWSGSLTHPPTGPCLGLALEQNGQDCRWWALTEDYAGHVFTAVADDDGDVMFKDTCDGDAITVFENSGNEEDVVPAGAGCAVMWNYADQTESATVTLTIF